jgi:predicted TPR repeat methyltransferase
MAAGLEGSDYSIKHGRANWPALANRNLFTCDISKPFRLFAGDSPATFDLMTAWEVLEHIHPDDLQTLFDNIDSHLNPGGYFVASTTSSPDLHDGIDRHQSKFSNQEWHALIGKLQPGWRPVNLGLKYYHYVRWNYYERSFLCWRKK